MISEGPPCSECCLLLSSKRSMEHATVHMGLACVAPAESPQRTIWGASLRRSFVIGSKRTSHRRPRVVKPLWLLQWCCRCCTMLYVLCRVLQAVSFARPWPFANVSMIAGALNGRSLPESGWSGHTTIWPARLEELSMISLTRLCHDCASTTNNWITLILWLLEWTGQRRCLFFNCGIRKPNPLELRMLQWYRLEVWANLEKVRLLQMNSLEPKSRFLTHLQVWHGRVWQLHLDFTWFCYVSKFFPSCLYARLIQTGKKTSQQHVINQARCLFLLRCGNKGCRIRLLEVRPTRSHPHAQSIYLELGTAVAFLHQSLNSTHGTQTTALKSRETTTDHVLNHDRSCLQAKVMGF